MFVSEIQGRLSLVRQDDHMRQTAELAGLWDLRALADPADRQALARALALHDVGWRAIDDALPYDEDTKRPRNFLAIDLAEHVRLYSESYAVARDDSDAAGLLVGMHWIGLYTRRYGLEPDGKYEVSGPEEEDLRRQTIDEVEASWIPLEHRLRPDTRRRADFEDARWRQYEAFQFLDRLSIVMSTRDMDEPGEWSVGATRLGGTLYREPVVRSRGQRELLLDPFPFECEFSTVVTRRLLPDRDYGSQEEVRAAWDAAAVEDVEIHVSGI